MKTRDGLEIMLLHWPTRTILRDAWFAYFDFHDSVLAANDAF